MDLKVTRVKVDLAVFLVITSMVSQEYLDLKVRKDKKAKVDWMVYQA